MKQLVGLFFLALLTQNTQYAQAQEHGRVNKQVIRDAIESKADIVKLTLTITELQDSSGLVYFGGKVEANQISQYLTQLKTKLGKEFDIYRANQAARDHHTFHLTLINPFELKEIDGAGLVNKKIEVILHGVGKAQNENSSAYYVVASSHQGQFLRTSKGLQQKDFHITLGFKPTDVYNRGKGVDTLISQ